MEKQIKRGLISMRKIANLTSTSRIDVSNGDIDEFVPTRASEMYRYIFHSRKRVLKTLNDKYSEMKDMVRFIMESANFQEQLSTIKRAIVNTRMGLESYKSNPRYKDDMDIKSNIEHIIQDEIPALIERINIYMRKHGLVDHAAEAPCDEKSD